MKDSQPDVLAHFVFGKYIKESNERFSTDPTRRAGSK